MRKLTPALPACLAAAVLLAAVAAPPSAARPRPKADLVTKQVTASLSNGRVTAGALVKNKGAKAAGASKATFYLSTDAAQSSGDVTLGTAQVRKVKPKKSTRISGTFTVPGTMAPGAYHVVVCADSTGAVKERKETNNCAGTSGTVTIAGTGPTTGPVSVAATGSTGGSVTVSDVTGGSCVTTACTFPTPGTGTVTFTPVPQSGYRFGAWTGATCTGYTPGANGKITFTKPTSAKACIATFVRQVTVTYSVAPVQLTLVGQVNAVATGGSCTDDMLSGGGSCVIDAGTGTVVLTAGALILPFKNWSGDCTGTTNPKSLSNLSADASCTANFGL